MYYESQTPGHGPPSPARKEEPTTNLFETVAYAEFSHRLDLELMQLVERWSHAAAPNASGGRHRRRP